MKTDREIISQGKTKTEMHQPNTENRQRQEVERTRAHLPFLDCFASYCSSALTTVITKSLITNSSATPKIQLIKKLIQHDISLL